MWSHNTFCKKVLEWNQIDPNAESFYGLSSYVAMGNNPVVMVDPDGDFPVLASVLIGAAVGVLVNSVANEINGVPIFHGTGKAAFVGAIGGFLGQFGGGPLLANLAWGAAEGGITGGLYAEMNGGSFGKGFIYGALAGTVFAATGSGIEALINYTQGYGFRTNHGVLKNYFRESSYQKAIDFIKDKYNLTGPKITYDASLKTAYGVTYLESGNIVIGSYAFKSPDLLKATIIHEYAHSVFGRALIDGKWIWTSKGSEWNYFDGIIGYKAEIHYAGRMHIGREVLKATFSSPGRHWTYGSIKLLNKLPLNPVWYAEGVVKHKWWYVLPKRF